MINRCLRFVFKYLVISIILTAELLSVFVKMCCLLLIQ